MAKVSESKELSNEKIKTLTKVMEKQKEQMAMALPKHMTPERLTRIALTELRQTPKLLDCDSKSFLKCIMVAAQLGLEPGMLGHAYLVPYGKECTLIMGYKGMIELARRSGQIQSIEARNVYSNDFCEVTFGLNADLVHKIDIRAESRGDFIGSYAVAHLKDGGKQFEFMPKAEIEKIRTSSKAGNFGPWKDHYEEMAKKSVIRRLFKYLPVSIEVQKAVVLDEASDSDNANYTQASVLSKEFDDDFFDIDLETGEIKDEANSLNQAEALANQIK